MPPPASEFIPVTVINLARAADRRARMRAQLDEIGVRFSIFNAVDGRTISAAKVAELDPRPIARDNFRAWLPGELGYQASYRQVVGMIASGEERLVCVLEDDAELTPAFRDFVTRSVLDGLPPFDVLRLESSWAGRHLPVATVGNIQVAAPYRLGPLACGQIISRRAAKHILNRMVPSREPFDLMLYMDRRFPSLRILDVEPAVVRQVIVGSDIDPRGERCAPVHLSPIQKLRSRLFRAGCDFRVATGFARTWGIGAKRRCRMKGT